MTGASAQHYRTLRPRRRRAGVSLIELIASAAIIGVLAVALGSTMILSARANEQAVQLVETPNNQGIVKQIASDLQLAGAFTERTDTSVTFTVPDRDGDNIPETISYAWSGIPGDPLVYRYNNSSLVTIADDVHSFALSYLLRTTQGIPQGPQEQESAEMLLIFHDDAPGGILNFRIIARKKGAAQYFKPTLPTNTTKWKITRARVMAETNGSATGTLTFRITTADGAMKPTSLVLETVQIPESSLGGWAYIEIPFGSTSDLNPAAGYCLTILDGASGLSGNIRWEKNGSPMTANTHYMTTNNTGSSWTNPVDNEDMLFEIYGTVTTTGEPQWP
ncbi:MAG: prepilin-type N-terminal cleavage/methylation domain-containing protein [Phycisphaerae bacterium]|nr:prepilin-type N-terminal cleavage/methylation domain-containing protein [Phycisphaerae bacterium]